jgi:WYL domain
MASTAYVTFTVPTTIQIPRTITPDTDPQTVDYATRAFYGVTYSWHNWQDGDGLLAARETIQTFITALMERTAVTVLYEDAKRDLTARTLYPSAIMLTEEHYVACKAYCTYRRQTQTFRLDRMRCVHPVTMPAAPLAA